MDMSKIKFGDRVRFRNGEYGLVDVIYSDLKNQAAGAICPFMVLDYNRGKGAESVIVTLTSGRYMRDLSTLPNDEHPFDIIEIVRLDMVGHVPDRAAWIQFACSAMIANGHTNSLAASNSADDMLMRLQERFPS